MGRGTSTFDGYAIAYAVLRELVDHNKCLGLFSTHYNMLTEDFVEDENVALKHMACLLEENKRNVVFLYKLTDGVR